MVKILCEILAIIAKNFLRVKSLKYCVKFWQSRRKIPNPVQGCVTGWEKCFQFFLSFALSVWLNQVIRGFFGGGDHIKKLGQDLYLGVKEVGEKIIENKLRVSRARLSIWNPSILVFNYRNWWTHWDNSIVVSKFLLRKRKKQIGHWKSKWREPAGEKQKGCSQHQNWDDECKNQATEEKLQVIGWNQTKGEKM